MFCFVSYVCIYYGTSLELILFYFWIWTSKIYLWVIVRSPMLNTETCRVLTVKMWSVNLQQLCWICTVFIPVCSQCPPDTGAPSWLCHFHRSVGHTLHSITGAVPFFSGSHIQLSNIKCGFWKLWCKWNFQRYHINFIFYLPYFSFYHSFLDISKSLQGLILQYQWDCLAFLFCFC